MPKYVEVTRLYPVDALERLRMRPDLKVDASEDGEMVVLYVEIADNSRRSGCK